MKDLDFDELDKAVNSLMQTVPETQPAADTPVPQPAATPVSVATALPASPGQPGVKPTEPVVKASPNLAEKRPGRFMDVMHPSSDMRSGQPSLPSTRPGVSISPINPNVTPETPKASDEEEVLTDDPALTASREKETTTLPASTPWPDPIDVHESLQDESKEADPVLTPKTEAASEEKAVDESVSTDETPKEKTTPESTSPFLSDAKVEKRPLGGGNGSTSLETEKQPDSSNLSNTKSEDSPKDSSKESVASDAETPVDDATADEDKGKDTKAQIPLPAELGEEITAIEADSSSRHAPKELPLQTPAIPEPASFIPKQYKEKESTSNSEHAAIYDNNTQPLAHPEKKKSGWGVVILILVLITLGGGGAAALFFLGII